MRSLFVFTVTFVTFFACGIAEAIPWQIFNPQQECDPSDRWEEPQEDWEEPQEEKEESIIIQEDAAPADRRSAPEKGP